MIAGTDIARVDGTNPSVNGDNKTKPVAGAGGRTVSPCSGRKNVGISGDGILMTGNSPRPLYVDCGFHVPVKPQTTLSKVKTALKMDTMLCRPCCRRGTENVGNCDSMSDGAKDSTVIRQGPAANNGDKAGSVSGGDDGTSVFSVTEAQRHNEPALRKEGEDDGLDDHPCVRLLRAVLDNNIDEVNSLVTEDNVNRVVYKNASLLKWACYSDDKDNKDDKDDKLEIQRQLLEKGADVYAVDDTGGTALHSAAIDGCFETVELLVETGGEKLINMLKNSGLSALLYAVRNIHRENNQRVYEFLVKKGARPDEVMSLGGIKITPGDLRYISKIEWDELVKLPEASLSEGVKNYISVINELTSGNPENEFSQ